MSKENGNNNGNNLDEIIYPATEYSFKDDDKEKDLEVAKENAPSIYKNYWKKVAATAAGIAAVTALGIGIYSSWDLIYHPKLNRTKAVYEGKFDVLTSSFTQVKSGLEKKLKEQRDEIATMKKTAKEFEGMNKSVIIQEKVNKNYDEHNNILYMAEINADENALEIETGAIKKDGPVINKYNRTFCGARYIIKEDLKEILGKEWKQFEVFEEEYENSNLDLLLNLKKCGKELKMVSWDKYDTVYSEKASISLDDNDLRKIKKMLDKYRNGENGVTR